MRIRSKLCFECDSEHRILYRCKYERNDWVFLCQQCYSILNQNMETHTSMAVHGKSLSKYLHIT